VNYTTSQIFHLPNCGITAISLVSGIEYDTVWRTFMAVNRKRKNWRGRAYNGEMTKTMNSLQIHGKFYSDICEVRPIKLKEFAIVTEKDESAYIAHITWHLLAVHKGIIGDQHSIAHYSEFKGRNGYIKNVWEIYKGA